MKNEHLICRDCSKEDACKYKPQFGHAVTAIMDTNIGYAERCVEGCEPVERLRDNDFISVDIKCRHWAKAIVLTRGVLA